VTATFLRELRQMLTPATAWHPLACANAENVMLGEFQQASADAHGNHDGPTASVPVRWNLPCAIRYLADTWENCQRFTPPGERGGYYGAAKQKLRESVIAALAPQCPAHDLWNVTEHQRALRILDAAIDAVEQKGRAA
jgi:hypothetical protein